MCEREKEGEALFIGRGDDVKGEREEEGIERERGKEKGSSDAIPHNNDPTTIHLQYAVHRSDRSVLQRELMRLRKKKERVQNISGWKGCKTRRYTLPHLPFVLRPSNKYSDPLASVSAD